VLQPARHSTLRPTLDPEFDTHGALPRSIGEFEDRALLTVFAARGLGVVPENRLDAGDVRPMRGLWRLGGSDDLNDEIHAIRSRRAQHHPFVAHVVNAPES